MEFEKNCEINCIRKYDVYKAFKEGKGEKVFILTSEFPFMVIGKIVKGQSDYILIDVEVTHISELEGKKIYIRLDCIEVFYIENEEHKIPNIYDNNSHMKRGDE